VLLRPSLLVQFFSVVIGESLELVHLTLIMIGWSTWP